jgi:hypothetical protein
MTDVTDAIHYDRRRFHRTGALTIVAAQLGIFGRVQRINAYHAKLPRIARSWPVQPAVERHEMDAYRGCSRGTRESLDLHGAIPRPFDGRTG